MSLLDVVNATSRNVTEKTKNMQELANLKRKITYEQERIVEIFTDIGKKYYEKAEGSTDFSDLKVLCEDVDTRRRRIKKMLFELNNMRGYKICPQCHAQVSGKYKFCGTCGAKIPDPEDDDFMETPEMLDGIEES